MNELFKLTLKLSISGSIFFILFYILSFFTKKVFSAKWHLIILKINMIFYFIPIVLFYDYFNKGQKGINENSFNIVFNDIVRSNYSIKITEYLFTIWLLGIVIISFWNFYCYKKFIKSIKNSFYGDEELDNAIYNCRINLNIDYKVKIKRSHIVSSPMLIGMINPMIIFPGNMRYSSKLEPVIVHELIHYKRKDLLFKLIQLGIMTINWFNPIVYLMNNIFEKWCEISCDEIVAENMSYSERKEYGETVLSIIEGLSITSNNLCFYLCSDKKYIKRRLIMMLNIKKPNKFKRILGGALICVVVLCSAVISFGTTGTIDNSTDNFVIETNDASIRKMLEGQIDEIKNDINTTGINRGSTIVIDMKTGEELGKLIYN